MASDDFLTGLVDDDHYGVLFIDDGTLDVAEIADIVHAISEGVEQDQIGGVFYVSLNWL